MHVLILGKTSSRAYTNSSAPINSFSISFIILITPAFLILIWGFPTFHFIATFNIFLMILNPFSLMTGSNYFWDISSSSNTKVSILISMSHSKEIEYSITVRISFMNLFASPWQLRTIVSNLNLFLLVFVQFMYYFDSIMFWSTGPT